MDYDEGPVFRFYLKGNEGHNLTNYRPVSDFTGKNGGRPVMQCSIRSQVWWTKPPGATSSVATDPSWPSR